MKRLVPASKAWRALPLAGSGFGLVAFVRDVDGEQSHRETGSWLKTFTPRPFSREETAR